jgi:hypothetical protein
MSDRFLSYFLCRKMAGTATRFRYPWSCSVSLAVRYSGHIERRKMTKASRPPYIFHSWWSADWFGIREMTDMYLGVSRRSTTTPARDSTIRRRLASVDPQRPFGLLTPQRQLPGRNGRSRRQVGRQVIGHCRHSSTDVDLAAIYAH